MRGSWICVILFLLLAVLLTVFYCMLDSRLGEVSLSSYLVWEFSTQTDRYRLEQPRDLLVTVICELPQQGIDEQAEQALNRMTRITEAHVDCTGRHFRYTFACPVYDWSASDMACLTEYCRAGLGEIELLLPSVCPDSDNLRRLLTRSVSSLEQSSFVIVRSSERSSERKASPDRKAELLLLRDFGCYADFSFPDPASSLQPSRINTVTSVSHQADSDNPYKDAASIKSGAVSYGDLFVIDGPMIIDWTNWCGLFNPSVEFGRLSYYSPPDTTRIERWIRADVHVDGQPNWVFVKLILSDHFLAGSSSELLESLDHTLDCLERRLAEGDEYRLHYVTAREMYNIARAAEAGKTSPVARYVDYRSQP